MTGPQHAFGDYQLEIYGAGLQGVMPRFPMAFAELEARAEQALPPSVLSYVAGGAGSEHTQRANVTAFRPGEPGVQCDHDARKRPSGVWRGGSGNCVRRSSGTKPGGGSPRPPGFAAVRPTSSSWGA